MSNNYLTVTVLNGYIKNIISSEEILNNINLVGEISGYKTSGMHAYFTLKDDNAQIDCTCFRYVKTYQPKSGESVVLKGSVSFYEKGGKLSFNVDTITPLGQGALALQLEERKKRLLAQGFFAPEHKKEIPVYPKKVCVLTAKTGAVIHDIITTIRKKNNIVDISLYDVKVQGIEAADSIIEGIRAVDGLDYDVLIIARGGGSLEDLMPFNDEKLVYAIYDAKTPIISAVGHDTDFTLCDFVADLRVPTPTASGEKVGFDVELLKATFREFNNKFATILEKKLEYNYLILNRIVKAMGAAFNTKYLSEKSQIDAIIKSMSYAYERKWTEKRNQLQVLMNKLDGNNPTKILKQGYCKLYNEAGLAMEISQATVGDKIMVFGADGRLSAEVLDVVKE